MQQPQKLVASLREVVARVCDGSIPAEPALEVSIADLAWQKLPLADSDARLVLNYETQGGELPIVQTDNLQFRSDATYIITGGFGGFGQKTAQWLVDNGARHLVLTGRTGADTPERQAIVAELEKQGVSAMAAACDTSDMERLTEMFQTIDATMPPLRGVFHSGALIIDQPINEMDHKTFAKVMRSKALGAWNLHLLTKDRELDCFVLYSSIANLVGNSRQSGYSAANGYLNGLAHMRQLMGLPGTSVNWGAIADVGVVAQDEKLEAFLRYTGLRGIQSSEGLDLLKVGLARQASQFGVTVITSWQDWARFETRGSTSPRFASLIAADSAGKDTSMRDALVAELSKLDPADQVVLLANLIVEIVASVLRSDPANIPIDKAIDSLGVDSLMATEIQMLLDTNLGLSVSILELIGNVTVRTLATQCLKTLTGVAADSAVPVAAS
jgi:NADP-dependent 3-hydroxy acid dehydrogenase YdfG/acyl carrier protein